MYAFFKVKYKCNIIMSKKIVDRCYNVEVLHEMKGNLLIHTDSKRAALMVDD